MDSCGKARALSRPELLASLGGAALFAFGKPGHAAAVPAAQAPLRIPPGLSPGAARAASLASRSPFARKNFEALVSIAHSIRDEALRARILELIADPVPRYAVRLRDAAARDRLRAALVSVQSIARPDAIDSLLPSADRDMRSAVQPIWAAPGSGQDSHHAYPGGLVAHELFNARTAASLAAHYDIEYFGREPTLNHDVVIAAALYHDIMKTVVFAWNDDGTLWKEPEIAATGAHHVLSGAEAIVRGESAAFVTVLLSAHAAPSLGDEAKVAAWAAASALVAGVDPVEYGLLRRTATGYALAGLAPIEAFVSNLSDHDYVLTVHAMHEVAPRIDAILAASRIEPHERLWHRNAVLCAHSAVALYRELARDERAFSKLVERAL